jgi:hypothetical protein
MTASLATILETLRKYSRRAVVFRGKGTLFINDSLVQVIRAKHPGGRPRKEAFQQIKIAYWTRRDAGHAPPDPRERGEVDREVTAIRVGQGCVACGNVPKTTIRNTIMYCLDHPESRPKFQN